MFDCPIIQSCEMKKLCHSISALFVEEYLPQSTKKHSTVLEQYSKFAVHIYISWDTVKLKSSYCLSGNFFLLCGHVNVHN